MIGLKSTNFKTVVLPTPVTDMMALYEFINDKSKYEKYIKELKKFTDEANEAIANVGKAKELDNLIAEAARLKEAAKEEHADERAKVEDIVGAAEEKAKSIIADAEAISGKMTSEAETLLATTKNKAAVLADDRVVATGQMKEADKLTAELDKRQAKIEKIESEIAEKKKLLAQL